MRLLCAQQRMKKYADAKRTEDEFQVEDKVFLKLRPYKQKSLAAHPNQKLATRFYGPYMLLACIGVVAYKLDLSSSSLTHPFLHISQLGRTKGASYTSAKTVVAYSWDGTILFRNSFEGVAPCKTPSNLL